MPRGAVSGLQLLSLVMGEGKHQEEEGAGGARKVCLNDLCSLAALCVRVLINRGKFIHCN